MKKCIICGGEQKSLFNYKHFHYYRCQKCQQVSTYPLPNNTMIKKHYADKFREGNYQLLRKYSEQYKIVYAYFVKLLKEQCEQQNTTLKNKKILDIGCFTGEFLELMQQQGADVHGLELQPEAVKIANKKMPGRVYEADVMSYKFSQKKYDIITLFGLVEHVTNPMQLLERCYNLLSKDGIIMVQTPNSSSLLARSMKKYWPPFSPIEHIHLFSRKSLEYALHNAGFENLHFRAHQKKLPVGYVYNMLNNFGPEFHKVLKPIESIVTNSRTVLPFYVGEMIIIGTKKR
jgi:2-polyprenyl-3-methyl-5-hydroxy-6-metoxy-1,4-benzoquinol methylase